MARKLKDADLDSREGRRKLRPRSKPYYCKVERERAHLGYRRLADAKGRDGKKHPQAGSWIVRHYIGQQNYQVEKIGIADDLSDPDGIAVLSFDEAITAARARMAVRSENAAGRNGKMWTVNDAMADYLNYLETEKKSAKDTRYKAEALILPKFGDRDIVSLTTDDLRQWLADLAKSPPRVRSAKTGKKAKGQRYRKMDATDDEARRRRKSTSNRVLTIFKAALNRAFNDGKVKSDTAWRRVKPFESVDAAREDYLTLEEAQRLINGAQPDFRSIVQGGLLSAARYGELSRMKVRDFSEENSTLAVRTNKSGKPRFIILTKEGVVFFRQMTAGRGRDEFIFLKANGQPWGASHQTRLMRAACQRAKITPAIGFHILRHTWASLSAQADMPLLVLAQNLGHSSTRMTEKHYAHLSRAYERAQVQKGAPVFGIDVKSNVRKLSRAKR